jgi:hypothetical protein
VHFCRGQNKVLLQCFVTPFQIFNQAGFMKNVFCSFAILSLFFCSSCGDSTTKAVTTIPTKTEREKPTPPGNTQDPNFNFTVVLPDGWASSDTTMEGTRFRFIYAPASFEKEDPSVNILVAQMEGKEVDVFMGNNIDYLKKNMEGITILDKGTLDVSGISARWFTYDKVQNGVKREVVNYIIPLRGYAYMITAGTATGYRQQLRPVFDGIARSFKG